MATSAPSMSACVLASAARRGAQDGDVVGRDPTTAGVSDREGLGKELRRAGGMEEPIISWDGATVELESVVEKQGGDVEVRFYVVPPARFGPRLRRRLTSENGWTATPWRHV